MPKRPWYKRFPADFIAGAAGLSAEEKGVYSTLIDLMYDRGEPIEDDAEALARICGCESVKRYGVIRNRLITLKKVHRTEGGQLSNRRFEKDYPRNQHEADLLSEAGRQGRASQTGAVPNGGELEGGLNDINGVTHIKARAVHMPEARVQKDSEEEQTLVAGPLTKRGWPVDFEARFWERYPRRIAKAAAMKALRKVHDAGEVAWVTIEAGVERYLAAIQRNRTEDRFIKHPATWINQGCWDDDHGPGPGGGPKAGFFDIASGR